MMAAAEELAQMVNVATACQALGVPRSALYRARQPAAEPPRSATPRPAPARALSEPEQVAVQEVLNSERFQDQAPREVYATLLDAGEYLCSWRTMYRILDLYDEVRERRDQLRHPVYVRPELLATGPKQLWSWDITKLRGPTRGTCYYLYVILDVFSRYVPGWLIAEHQTAELAEELIAETCRKQDIARDTLTIHADNGGPMIAKPIGLLLADLGVNKSHSRPHVANDNPFSEAQFRTLKYWPSYPERFGALLAARQWAHDFFDWYNNEHHHTGLALLTPADVHYGRAEAVLAARQAVLQRAYEAHPERFVRGIPTVPRPPVAVWINPPKTGEPSPVAAEQANQQPDLAATTKGLIVC